ncbi:transposase [Streptomyces hirsutus]
MVALPRHDLLRLLESLRSEGGPGLVREIAERLPQEPIEAEATARIGAEWGEHSGTRPTWRNGHREKTVTTQAGDLNARSRNRGPPRCPGRSPDV